MIGDESTNLFIEVDILSTKKSVKYCKFCNKVLKNKRSVYCSNTCHNNQTEKETIENWKADGTTPTGYVTDAIRRYLFIKYESKCSMCGWNKVNPKSNKIPLEVEHIDGNSSNNLESNLILLCPNCHSLTPTYKALNRGNGRHTRAQRYRDGKSY